MLYCLSLRWPWIGSCNSPDTRNMLSPARWLFTVGNPHDAKLRGWLHPICATFFNACLAFCIAFAVFLLSPLPNTEEWQQQQPQFVRSTVSAVQRQSHELMVLTGLTSEGIDAVKGIVRGIFLPELTLHDKEQAFALYNWNVDGGNAHVDGTPKLGSMHSALLLLYVVVLCGCRVWEKGPWIIYEMSWACNIAMCLASAGNKQSQSTILLLRSCAWFLSRFKTSEFQTCQGHCTQGFG